MSPRLLSDPGDKSVYFLGVRAIQQEPRIPKKVDNNATNGLDYQGLSLGEPQPGSCGI